MYEDDLLLTAPPRRRVWRFLLLFLITAVVFVTTYALILPAITAEPVTLLEGDLSDTISYTLTQAGEIYTLTISGTGGMPGYNNSTQSLESRPWHPYLENITSFVVTEGITSVGQGACNGCTSLTSVTLPDSVNTLVAYAFTDCKALKEIVLPESVTTIGAGVFKGCTALESVIMPGVTRVQSSAFHGCTSLKSIDLSRVTYFEQGAFSYCKSLTEISLSDELKTLPYSLFNGCSSLTTVNLPDALEGIDGYVFANCKSLQSIDLPNTVTSIGADAFNGCSSLTSIDLPNVTTIGNSAFSGCSALVTVTFGESSLLTSVGENTFSGCSSLTAIDIPDGITYLSTNMFNGCSALNTVTLPKNLETIGYAAFSGCSALTSIDIPNTVTTIAGYAFNGCKALETVTIPVGVTVINDYAFNNCSSLESAEVLGEVTSIGRAAFGGCHALAAFTIPNTVTSIGAQAFQDCKALTEIVIPDSVTTLHESYPFYQCTSLKKVTIGNGVTAIPYRAFAYCPELETVIIGNSVKTIGKDAFLNDVKLTSIILPDSVTTIGHAAFGKCYALETVTMGKGVTTIESNAFLNNVKLTNLTLSDALESIGAGAFQMCDSLTEVHLPDSVTTIKYMAFFKCKALTKVTGGNGLKTIAHDAFSGCTVLESINLPEGLTGIGSFAFYGCTKLDNIVLPSTLTYLGDQSAFENCTSLSGHIVVPGSLEKLPVQTFIRCSKLNKVTLEEGVTAIGDSAFETCTSLQEVILPSTLTTIGNRAFVNTWALEQLVLPDNVTTIGNSCFEGSGVRAITLSDGITAIPTKAFYKSQLETFTIPAGITSIGSQAFGACRRLETLHWDATSLETLDPDAFKNGMSEDYTLCIGDKVESLPNNFGAALETALRGSIVFEGPNEGIQLTADAMAGLDAPLCYLNGTYYVDEHGVLYDSAEKTTLYYCPPGLTEYTVPTTVTAIAPHAFSLASDLASVTFEKPETVLTIGYGAFFDCAALKSVNGAATVEGANALFKVDVPADAFENSGLVNSAAAGTTSTDMLVYVSDETDGNGLRLTIGLPSNDVGTINENTGVYELLTGESALPVISAQTAGETDVSNTKFRVYLEFSDSDFQTTLKVGETAYYGDNQTPVTMYATDNPSVCYLEFMPNVGETLSFSLPSIYPNITSDGGTMRIWGEIVKTGAASSSQRAAEYHEYLWKTERQEYKATVGKTGSAILNGLGNNSTTVQLGSDIGFPITHTKTGNTPDTQHGSDPLQRISYTNTLSLPEAMWWNPALVKAIEDGTYRFDQVSNGTIQLLYPDENGVYKGAIRIQAPNYLETHHLSPVSVALDESGNLTVGWDRWQADNTTALVAAQTTFTLLSGAVYADVTKYGEGYVNNQDSISSTVNATYHYTWSDDYSDEAVSATYPIQEAKASLYTLKTRKTAGSTFYMGQAVEYQIEAGNKGALPLTTLADVTDRLANNFLYITPADMERMFAGVRGDLLSITIAKAKLFTYSGKSTGTAANSKTEVALNAANSSHDTAPKTATIVIKAVEGRYAITCTVEGAESVTTVYSHVADGLNALGYAVTADDIYTAVWHFNGEAIYGGVSYLLPVYATHKTSFQNLEKDWEHWYAYHKTDPLTVNNVASYTTTAGSTANVPFNGTSSHKLYYDLSVFKQLTKDGKVYNSETMGEITFHDEDFLDYTVNYNHTGSGEYTDMPIVDVLTGAQSLLVPVEKNKDAEWALPSLKIVERDGKSYYRLDAAGTYSGVWVGTDENGKMMYADSVAVEVEGNNRTTTIKWYLANLTGTGEHYIHYEAQIVAGDQFVFSFNNTVFLNDKVDSRLYASLGGNGTALDMKKQIVEHPDLDGTAPLQEKVDEDDYSILDANSKVDYKITLTCTGTGTRKVTFDEIFDRLPLTFGAFEWTLNKNVWVTIRTDDGAVNGLQDAFITTQTPGGRWEETKGQYYLCWGSGELTFTDNSEVYIYVTLQYPEEGEAWEAYCEGSRGERIENAVYVYGFPDNVVHDLRGESKALLQKGVVQITERKRGESAVDTMFPIDFTRHHYSNSIHLYGNSTGDDTNNWGYFTYVQYYVTLYNSSNTRLYLSDLQDQLPAGFSFKTLTDGATDGKNFYYASNDSFKIGTTTKLVTTVNGCKSLATVTEDGLSADYVTATVSVKTSGQKLTFTITEDEDFPETSIHYDEQEGRYYLLRGEALVFGYVALVSTADKTEDVATNVIGMPYYDPLRCELKPDTVTKVTGSNVVSALYNDGQRAWITAKRASEEYGFTVGTETQWLTSDVTLRRDVTVPGISKSIVTEQLSGATELPYNGVAEPTAKLGWKVKLMNDGNRTINGYTITDTMQSPYSFDGTVSYRMYRSTGQRGAYAEDLFTINRGADGSITLVDYNNISYSLTLGEPTVIPVLYYLCDTQQSKDYYTTFTVCLQQAENGDEVLSITVPENVLPLRVDEYAELTVHTKNNSESRPNAVFVNQAVFTPLAEYDEEKVQNGINTVDEKGENAGVLASSFVTVATGYSTTSQKTVTEKENAANTASSNDEQNAIVLQAADSVFTYALEVRNASGKAMSKLVLIDNLPQPNDTYTYADTASRGSTATVVLAPTPSFKVVVTAKDGPPTELAAEQYTVEYSAKASNFTAEDRAGIAGGWATTADAGTRSVRIAINDSSGTLIPAGATVVVSFDCAFASPQAGAIAWNSFGYHYGLTDVSTELEAAPLKVGVKVPTVPELSKMTVDRNGDPITLTADTPFTFIVYEGKAQDLPADESLTLRLRENNTPYQTFTITVPAGTSVSDTIQLQAEDWSWENGKTYTIVEVLSTSDNRFRFESWNSTYQTRSHTFTYRNDMTLRLTATNALRQWDLQLAKTDSRDAIKRLGGAVFALYSPAATDQMPKETFDALKIDGLKDTLSISGKTWYLTDVKTTTAEGTADWSDLIQESYYVKEVQAPKGYYLPEDGFLVSRPTSDGETTVFQTVTNEAIPYSLPETGGKGAFPYYGAGAVLVLSACALYSFILLRKRKARSS